MLAQRGRVLTLVVILLSGIGPRLACAQLESACVQYPPPPPDPTTTSTAFHCETALTPCAFVFTGGAALTEIESQVGRVLNQAGIAAEEGVLSETCLTGFRSLYCPYVYPVCESQSSGGGESSAGHYTPTNTSVCEEDCRTVIRGNCTSSQWSYLTNIVMELRIGNHHLPELPQIEECNKSRAVGGSCRPLQTNVMSDIGCLLTEPPQSPTPSSSEATIITAVCLGVGIPVLSLSVILFLVIFFICQLRKKPRRTNTDPYRERSSAGVRHPLEKVSDFKKDAHNRTQTGDQEQMRRGTLMMHKSAVHGALLNINVTPRSGTVVKRLGTKEFYQLTPKQRLQILDFPHSNICLLKDLWETNHGMTYIGEATGLETNVLSTTVLIKSLKERAVAKVQQQFMIEMTWASGFSHPNVISLLAVCREDPRYMIYEYLEYGSLKDFLQSIDSAWLDFDEVLNDAVSTCASTTVPALGYDDLCAISNQIAQGMAYLSKKAFVMKDLAARNCQVGQGLTVKIVNFGLSYDCHSKEYCCLSSAKNTPLPLRWLAPETIHHGKFSVYSDIWSYGILLWEVFTFGARPYDSLSNAQVVKSILGGECLPMPKHCPECVYGIMTRCWSESPSRRPWFSVLCREFRDLPSYLTGEKRTVGGLPSTPEILKKL